MFSQVVLSSCDFSNFKSDEKKFMEFIKDRFPNSKFKSLDSSHSIQDPLSFICGIVEKVKDPSWSNNELKVLLNLKSIFGPKKSFIVVLLEDFCQFAEEIKKGDIFIIQNYLAEYITGTAHQIPYILFASNTQGSTILTITDRKSDEIISKTIQKMKNTDQTFKPLEIKEKLDFIPSPQIAKKSSCLQSYKENIEIPMKRKKSPIKKLDEANPLLLSRDLGKNISFEIEKLKQYPQLPIVEKENTVESRETSESKPSIENLQKPLNSIKFDDEKDLNFITPINSPKLIKNYFSENKKNDINPLNNISTPIVKKPTITENVNNVSQSLKTRENLTKSSVLCFTKLNDLKPETVVNICGVVIFCRGPTLSSKNEFFTLVVLTDESMPTSSQGIRCMIFSKVNDLPVFQVKSVISLHRFRTQSFQGKIQILSQHGSIWTVFSQNSSGVFRVKSNETASSIYENMERVTKLYKWSQIIGFETVKSVKKLSDIFPNEPEFNLCAMVLGLFFFENPPECILIVTDATKCRINTFPNRPLSHSTWFKLAFFKLHTCADNYSYISVLVEDHIKVLANIHPLSTLFLTCSIEGEGIIRLVNGEKLPFQSLAEKCQEVVDLQEKLNSLHSDKSSIWNSISLPSLEFRNRQTHESTIEEEFSLPILSDQNLEKFSNVKKTTLKYLLYEQQPGDITLYHVSPRIVAIWPQTFIEGLKYYCDDCKANVHGSSITQIEDGSAICQGCRKLIPIKVSFIFLLNENDDYLPVVLIQQSALKFFGLSCNLKELTLENCRKVDVKYRDFFSRRTSFLTPLSRELSQLDIFILPRLVKNLGPDGNDQATVFEVCSAALV